jgi:hypothetical protein
MCSSGGEVRVKEILQEPWSYALYQDGEQLLLSVLCGTIGLYERNVVLDPDELASYREQGQPFIAELAQRIRSTPSQYQDRHVELRPGSLPKAGSSS